MLYKSEFNTNAKMNITWINGNFTTFMFSGSSQATSNNDLTHKEMMQLFDSPIDKSNFYKLDEKQMDNTKGEAGPIIAAAAAAVGGAIIGGADAYRNGKSVLKGALRGTGIGATVALSGFGSTALLLRAGRSVGSSAIGGAIAEAGVEVGCTSLCH